MSTSWGHRVSRYLSVKVFWRRWMFLSTHWIKKTTLAEAGGPYSISWRLGYGKMFISLPVRRNSSCLTMWAWHWSLMAFGVELKHSNVWVLRLLTLEQELDLHLSWGFSLLNADPGASQLPWLWEQIICNLSLFLWRTYYSSFFKQHDSLQY